MRTRTRAGILWTRDLQAYSVKILVGEYWIDKAKKSGDYDAMIESGRPYVPRGFMTLRGHRELEQLVGDLAPYFAPYFKQRSEHANSLGETLAQRARFCLPGHDELEPFKRPDIIPLYNLCLDRLGRSKPIEWEMLMACAAQNIECMADTLGPGVYIKQHPLCMRETYIGETSTTLKQRNKGHSNSPLENVRFYSTPTKKDAVILETELRNKAQVLLGARPYREGLRGLYLLPEEREIAPLIDRIISEHYSGWVRCTVTPFGIAHALNCAEPEFIFQQEAP